jgi:hypothetical protein
MEIIKRKIFLEDSIDRNYNSSTWGVMTASTFYIKINITQNIDDMGLFSDIDFIPFGKTAESKPNYKLLTDKLSGSGFTFPFMTSTVNPILINPTGTTKNIVRLPNSIESDYYNFGNSMISGATDSKIEDVASYARNNKYRTSLNIHTETYNNYKKVSISGVDRIHSMNEPRIYVFDTPNDLKLGTTKQDSGLRYLEYTGDSRTVVIDNIRIKIPLTEFYYIGEGWNMTNTSLSAITKEEYLFGIISPPEVQSDVYIDRGQTSVIDMHLRLSEIKNLSELARYGNGFYKLNKQ